MLSTSYLLSQMDILEAIKIENLVQSKVDFDSPVLYYLNSYLLKTPEKDLLKESFVNPEKLPIHDRFIYNCILEHYGLTAKDEKDFILSEVYSALYVKEYANEIKKANELERLFHKMKKHGIESEASPLLFQLWELNKGKPLEAVYKHLYNKYNKIQKVNEKGIKHFINLNSKLANLLEEKSENLSCKDLILEYKSIRRLNTNYENNNLSALLNLSKLVLVSICGQSQLLKERNQDIENLLTEVTKNVQKLPFGVEKFYLNNILDQVQLYIARDYCTELDLNEINEKTKVANNFSFPKNIIETVEKSISKNKGDKKAKKVGFKSVDKIMQPFVRNPFSSLTIPGDSLLVRSNI